MANLFHFRPTEPGPSILSMVERERLQADPLTPAERDRLRASAIQWGAPVEVHSVLPLIEVLPRLGYCRMEFVKWLRREGRVQS